MIPIMYSEGTGLAVSSCNYVITSFAAVHCQSRGTVPSPCPQRRELIRLI